MESGASRCSLSWRRRLVSSYAHQAISTVDSTATPRTRGTLPCSSANSGATISIELRCEVPDEHAVSAAPGVDAAVLDHEVRARLARPPTSDERVRDDCAIPNEPDRHRRDGDRRSTSNKTTFFIHSPQ